MEYRRLGKTGLKVSEFSYGSWVTFSNQLKLNEATEMMQLAYENGVNFFDNAEVYAAGQSEVIMGKVIKQLGWTRDSFIISSKVFWGGDKPSQRGLSHKHIVDACNNALTRFKLDYLDLYFCHRPDPDTPIEETVRAMHTLIMQGKICYWGTSEWSSKEIKKAFQIARDLNLTPPSMEQPEYNMFHRKKMEEDYQPLFQKEILGTTVWSPLASGVLTGKYMDGNPSDTRTGIANFKFIKDRIESEDYKPRHNKVKKLSELSKEIGLPLTNMALCWCLKNKNVSTVILGASKPEQLKQNLVSKKYYKLLDEGVMKKIESILEN